MAPRTPPLRFLEKTAEGRGGVLEETPLISNHISATISHTQNLWTFQISEGFKSVNTRGNSCANEKILL